MEVALLAEVTGCVELVGDAEVGVVLGAPSLDVEGGATFPDGSAFVERVLVVTVVLVDVDDSEPGCAPFDAWEQAATAIATASDVTEVLLNMNGCGFEITGDSFREAQS